MEIFANALSGPVVFLLILQILIVSGLVLTLIWFFIDRGKKNALTYAAEGGHGEIGSPAPTEPSSVTASAASLGTTPAAPVSAPVVAPVAAAPEAASKTVIEENTSLKEKVQYLESRLMEYEIVQEEISTLSALREQNEKLKEQITRLGATPDLSVSVPAAPKAPPVVTMSPPAAAVEETSSVVATSEPPPVAQPAQATEVPAAPVATAPAAASEPASNDQLDSILSQLDNLTAK